MFKFNYFPLFALIITTSVNAELGIRVGHGIPINSIDGSHAIVKDTSIIQEKRNGAAVNSGYNISIFYDKTFKKMGSTNLIFGVEGVFSESNVQKSIVSFKGQYDSIDPVIASVTNYDNSFINTNINTYIKVSQKFNKHVISARIGNSLFPFVENKTNIHLVKYARFYPGTNWIKTAFERSTKRTYDFSFAAGFLLGAEYGWNVAPDLQILFGIIWQKARIAYKNSASDYNDLFFDYRNQFHDYEDANSLISNVGLSYSL